MHIPVTETRIQLATSSPNGKVLAYARTILGDSYAVTDLKVIQGQQGPFVSMPSRMRRERCRRCNKNNPFNARFCNECGGKLPGPRDIPPHDPPLYEDVIFPIHDVARRTLTGAVLRAYEEELCYAGEK